MSMYITISEEEILETPNDFALGQLIRNKYWRERQSSQFFPVDDEHVLLDIAPDGSVKRIINSWTCSICNKDTSSVEFDYLIGTDHLGCHLKENSKSDKKDICVICGKETPYLYSTHINYRIGYVEGLGQLCSECYNK